MAERWIPRNVNFTLTGQEAKELAAARDPEAWMRVYLQRKYHLPETAEIDLSGLKIEAAKKEEE
jgi:hypothetical protein